jgi:hypothetical protein
MEKDKLVEYFRKNLKKGYPLDSLKLALINQGYSRILVNSAIQEVNKELAKEVPKFKEEPKITYEIINENNQPIKLKESWLRRLFRI